MNDLDRFPSRAQGQRTARALASAEHHTLLRLARVQAEGIVQSEKVKEINHIGREAVTDYALLRKFADTLATNDPFMADDLKFVTDLVKIGIGEMVADTIQNLSREGRS
jgi:hypothetical protein